MKRLMVVAVVAALMAVVFAVPASANHGTDYNCEEDFQWREDAQAHYDAHPGDPDGLDGNDNDGQACEMLPYRGTQSVDTDTSGGTTDTGATTRLPSTGTGGYLAGNTLGLSSGMLLAVAAAFGMTLVSGGLVFRRSLR